VTAALAKDRDHRRTTTAIGTVVALRSITLSNELAGTVRTVALTPGAIVAQGELLVALDVSVEAAELASQHAQAELAETLLGRVQRATQNKSAAAADLDRARAERDVALATIARTEAVIARKTIKAPFRARVGLADVHPGQYLEAGTKITTLQGVDDAVHVDFAVAQAVAAQLQPGDTVEVSAGNGQEPITAKIEALDSRVDRTTRNAYVRARIEGAAHAPAPGASVRVSVPVGSRHTVVTVPVNALRRGPAGDHVFVIAADAEGKPRAHVRQVKGGPTLGDDVVIASGLGSGEQVAASGSFKLREAVLVAIANASPAGGGGSH
jgi:membrane fusion protein (multidrug efflux system)